MIYKIVLSPEAIREIEIAECFFRANRIEHSFLNDLNQSLIYLEKYPLSRQIRYKTVRVHLLDKFNYSLHFTIFNDTVYILHFLNQKQNF